MSFMFRFSTKISYTGVRGLATECLCSVWCREITTIEITTTDPFFGNLVWNDSGFICLTYCRKKIHCFLLCFEYILMPHDMMILCFRLPYFHVSNSALFFTHYFSTLILHRRSLDTFYLNLMSLSYGAIYKVTMTLHHAVCSNAKCLRHTILSTKMVSLSWLWHVWICHYVFAIVLSGW